MKMQLQLCFTLLENNNCKPVTLASNQTSLQSTKNTYLDRNGLKKCESSFCLSPLSTPFPLKESPGRSIVANQFFFLHTHAHHVV